MRPTIAVITAVVIAANECDSVRDVELRFDRRIGPSARLTEGCSTDGLADRCEGVDRGRGGGHPLEVSSPRPAFARREVFLVGAGVGILLLSLSARYGYHRDELYFLEAGRHLAWGYPDQPPLVPLLARLADEVAPGSLVALRFASTLTAVATVVVTAMIAQELGAKRGGQLVAAIAAGLSATTLATGHLLSTTTIALLGWVTLTFILVRVINRGATTQLWMTAGLVAGLTLETNPLLVTFLVVFAAATLLAGPREILRTRGPWLAAAIAVVLAAPYFVWQVAHGLPQLDVAHAIANGGSGTSASRWVLLPMQLVIVGPWLSPIWITGLVVLWRQPRMRSLALSYAGLCVLFLIVGGKPYYLAGLYPLLIAAGAQPVLDRLRVWGTGALLIACLPVIVIALPVLPTSDAGWVVRLNYDTGETIGWPELVSQVATSYRSLPAATAIVTANYGEAGAIDRYGGALGLPHAYSGHMAYAEWGPPAASTTSVLAIGIDPRLLHSLFKSVTPLGTLRNPWGIANDENGTKLYACQGPRSPWRDMWPQLKHY